MEQESGAGHRPASHAAHRLGGRAARLDGRAARFRTPACIGGWAVALGVRLAR